MMFPKKKKVRRGDVDAKLWRYFSEYIRLRDTDSNGYGSCCTCGKTLYYKEGDAGHFISRKYKATKYNEQNNHLQCKKCNRFENGQQYRMSQYIDHKYGKGTSEKIEALSRVLTKNSSVWLEEQAKHYRELVKKMKKSKSLRG